MSEKVDKKRIAIVIIRQFAYLFLFIVMFFWANILTIIALIYSLFKQPLTMEELNKIYTDNFKALDKLL